MNKLLLFMLLLSFTISANEHGEEAPKKSPLPIIKKDPKDSPLAYICTPTKPNKQVKRVLIQGLYPGNSIGNEYLNWVVVEGKNALETAVRAEGTSTQKLTSDGPEKLILEMDTTNFPKVPGNIRFTGKSGEIEMKLQCGYKG